MSQFAAFLYCFLSEENGISSAEYALLLGFVAAGVMFAGETLSGAVEGQISDTADLFDPRCVQVDSNCDGFK